MEFLDCLATMESWALEDLLEVEAKPEVEGSKVTRVKQGRKETRVRCKVTLDNPWSYNEVTKGHERS